MDMIACLYNLVLILKLGTHWDMELKNVFAIFSFLFFTNWDGRIFNYNSDWIGLFFLLLFIHIPRSLQPSQICPLRV